MGDHNEKVKTLKPLVFARVSNMSGTVRGIYTRDMINSEMNEMNETNVGILNALATKDDIFATKSDIEETKCALKQFRLDMMIIGSFLAIMIIAALAVQLI